MSSETSSRSPGEDGGAVRADGLPGRLRVGLESLSGTDLSGLRVHTNSSKPAKIDALAYTQGEDIHLGPGQEEHLPHEAWHAVQQLQGRVKPTYGARVVPVNDDPALEHEADVMSARATKTSAKVNGLQVQRKMTQAPLTRVSVLQRQSWGRGSQRSTVIRGQRARAVFEFQRLPPDIRSLVRQNSYVRWVESEGSGVWDTLVGAHKLLSGSGRSWRMLRDIWWVGLGALRVHVDAATFKRQLEVEGFESKWFARRGSDLWGLRKTVGNVGLHVRGKARNDVEIHFDLHPPRWWRLGLWHKIQDDWRREKTLTPKTLRTALGL